MDQETALLTLAILAGQLLILVFGLFYVLSAFYFSRDLEFLVSLPARPFEVIAAKFGVILVNEYLTVALIVVPAFVVYGVMAGKPFGYWPLAALVFLLLPVIPLALSGLLVMAMMRLVNVSRKKDFLILAGSLTLLTATLFLQLGLVGNRSPEELMKFFTAADGLVRLVGEKFPPCIWASRLLAAGLQRPGPRSTWPSSPACRSRVLLLLLLAAEKLFYRGLIGLSEMAARRKKLSAAALAGRLANGRGAWRAILLREWKLMNRTPIFLLNGILSVVLVPVMLFFMVRSSAGSSSAGHPEAPGLGEPHGRDPVRRGFFRRLRLFERHRLLDLLARGQQFLDLQGDPGRPRPPGRWASSSIPTWSRSWAPWAARWRRGWPWAWAGRSSCRPPCWPWPPGCCSPP